MKPWKHAESSARRWGGKPAEYLPIHDFLDSSKSVVSAVNRWFGDNARVKVTRDAVVSEDYDCGH